MPDNRVRLIHEIDATPSIREAAKVEKSWDKAHKGIERGAKTTASKAATSSQLISGAIGGATAAVAAHQRSWAALGTSIVASFAAGGPVGGGIALLGAGIGFLSSETEKANPRMKALAAETLRLVEANKKLDREALVIQGVSLQEQELKKVNVELELAADNLDRIRKKSFKQEEGFFEPFRALGRAFTGALSPKQKAIEAASARESGVRDKRNALIENADKSKFNERLGFVVQVNRQLQDRTAIIRGTNAAARQRIQLEQQFRDILNKVGGQGPKKLRKLADAASEIGDKDKSANLRRFADELDTLKRRIEAVPSALAKSRSQNLLDSFTKESAALTRQNALLAESNPLLRARLRIQQETDRAIKRVDDLVGTSGISAEAKAAGEQFKLQLETRGDQAMENVRKQFPTAFESFTTSVGPAISSGLSQSIIAGVTSGGEAAQQVLLNLAQSLAGSLLNAGLSTLLGGGGAGSDFGGIFGGALSFLFPQGKRAAASGASFITQGTGLFFAGERGPELVAGDRNTTDVTPLSKLQGSSGDAAPVNITFNISGKADPAAIADQVRTTILRLRRTSRGRRVLGGR